MKLSIFVAVILTLVAGCAEQTPFKGTIDQAAPIPIKPDQSLPSASKDGAQEIEKMPPKKTIVIIYFSGEIDRANSSKLIAYVNDSFLREKVNDFVIYINSNGGNSESSMAMYQSLKSLPISITTVNIGAVESGAVWLYCSGSKRYSMPNSYFTIHGTTMSGATISSRVKLESYIKMYNSFYDIQKYILKSCSNMNESLIDKYINSSDFEHFTTREAKMIGIVQEIGSPIFEKYENVNFQVMLIQ